MLEGTQASDGMQEEHIKINAQGKGRAAKETLEFANGIAIPVFPKKNNVCQFPEHLAVLGKLYRSFGRLCLFCLEILFGILGMLEYVACRTESSR